MRRDNFRTNGNDSRRARGRRGNLATYGAVKMRNGSRRARGVRALCAVISLVLSLSACATNNSPAALMTSALPDSSAAAPTGSVGSTEPVITTATKSAVTEPPLTESAVTEPPLTESADTSTSVTGSWEIRYAVDKDAGTDIPLRDIYGSGIAYGGTLSLNQDGTFSKYIGVNNGDKDAYEGAYSVADNTVALEYGNGTVEYAEYLPESGELRILATHYAGAGDISIWEYFIKHRSVF